MQNEVDAYHIIVSAPRGDMTVAICNDKGIAVDLARYYYAHLAKWEGLYIKKYEHGHKTTVPQFIPYKVYTCDKKTGVIIEEVRHMNLKDSIERAKSFIRDYYAEDVADGISGNERYDVVNEYLESYITEGEKYNEKVQMEY